jgi:hypothetical protein
MADQTQTNSHDIDDTQINLSYLTLDKTRIKGDVQIRTENDGLVYFNSVKEAHKYYEENPSILKMSWISETGRHYRLCPITKLHVTEMSVESCKRIKDSCVTFDALELVDIIWIDQMLFDTNKMLQKFKSDAVTIAFNKYYSDSSDAVNKLEIDEIVSESLKYVQKMTDEIRDRFPTDESHESWYQAELITGSYTNEEFKRLFCN